MLATLRAVFSELPAAARRLARARGFSLTVVAFLGSAVAALDHLAQAGARDIRMICIVAAPEGVELVQRHHPGVRIYTPAIDRHLNDHKYIVPGLGDFGDRLYGTL